MKEAQEASKQYKRKNSIRGVCRECGEETFYSVSEDMDVIGWLQSTMILKCSAKGEWSLLDGYIWDFSNLDQK